MSNNCREKTFWGGLRASSLHWGGVQSDEVRIRHCSDTFLGKCMKPGSVIIKVREDKDIFTMFDDLP